MKIWWFGGFWCFLTRFYPSNAKTIDLGNYLRCAIIQNWGVFTLQSRVGKTNEKLLWLLEAEISKHKKMSVYWAFKARKQVFLNMVLTLNGRISINFQVWEYPSTFLETFGSTEFGIWKTKLRNLIFRSEKYHFRKGKLTLHRLNLCYLMVNLGWYGKNSVDLCLIFEIFFTGFRNGQ